MLPRVLHINISHTFPINFEKRYYKEGTLLYSACNANRRGRREIRSRRVCVHSWTNGGGEFLLEAISILARPVNPDRVEASRCTAEDSRRSRSHAEDRRAACLVYPQHCLAKWDGRLELEG